MTLQQWLDATKVVRRLLGNTTAEKGRVAQEEFESLDHAFQVFLNHRERGTARTALKAIKRWRVASGWTNDSGVFERQSLIVLSTGKAIRSAVDAAFNEIVRFLNGPVFDAFENEAARILRLFARNMGDVYAMKLEETFIGRDPLRESHHFQMLDDGKFARQFQWRGGAGTQYPIHGVEAFTGPNRGSSDAPPANRIICLREDRWSAATIFHELLHWSTHAAYEAEAKRHEGDDYNAVIEGVTEFFSRKGHPGRTSFPTELARVESALIKPGLTETALEEAYFRGAGVVTVVKRIAEADKGA